jgi:hypothetical protein
MRIMSILFFIFNYAALNKMAQVVMFLSNVTGSTVSDLYLGGSWYESWL